MITSFKTKMIAAILISTIVAVCAVGSMSIITANKILREKSEATLQLTCEQTGMKMNQVISGIRWSVDILNKRALNSGIDMKQFRSSDAYVREYTDRMASIVRTMAESTPGCLAVYIRYNPEIASPTSGLFLVWTPEQRQFVQQPPTDLSLYAKTDKEHVGWFYEAVEARHPVWMLPYENKNISTYMVSYVAPPRGRRAEYRYCRHGYRLFLYTEYGAGHIGLFFWLCLPDLWEYDHGAPFQSGLHAD